EKAAREAYCYCLDSNLHQDKYGKYEWLCAYGAAKQLIIRPDSPDALQQISDFLNQHPNEWIFFSISYDFKNHLEQLSSNNTDYFEFPDAVFTLPKTVIFKEKNAQEPGFYSYNSKQSKQEFFEEINAFNVEEKSNANPVDRQLNACMDFKQYQLAFEALMEEIRFGNTYEANLCMAFTNTVDHFEPFTTFTKLNQLSKAPFAAFTRHENHFLISASPERFIAKRQQQLIAQPIKGTAARAKEPTEDLARKNSLIHNPKERSENIMIVDLMRNDLSKICVRNSVEAVELCAVYSFEHVHQMISTIVGTLAEDKNFSEVLGALFPMGSMTGAPKISTMHIIERLENFKRSMYSGCVGYMNPNGDFDSSVIIRSLLYHQKKQQLTAAAGSAVTHRSSLHAEYEECLHKAAALMSVIGGCDDKD
ncbi:MAG: anthranilate synthase component I family protein, partial [Flavobacteriaceae bacterium]|nr:anthranilate synthase component I family protein [Flavobacteriaceae bacterium]